MPGFRISIDTSSMHRDAERARRDMDDLTIAARDTQRGMQGVGNASAAAAQKMALFSKVSVGVVGAFAAFVPVLVENALQMDRLSKAYQTLAGSAEGGRQQLEFVRQTANKLGLEYVSLAQSAQTFFAAAKGTSLEKDMNRIVSAVGMAASALALSSDQVGGVFTALGQMVSKGKVQAEELRGQLGERLPGAFKLAAEAMGMTTAELDKFMADGKLTAEDLLPRLADAFENQFAAGAEAASNGVSASINRMSNAWLDFKNAVTDNTVIITAINAVTKALQLMSAAANGLSSLGSSLGNRARAVYAGFAAEVQEERDFINDPTGRKMMDAIVPGGPVYDAGAAVKAKVATAQAAARAYTSKIAGTGKKVSGGARRSSGGTRRTSGGARPRVSRASGSSGSGGSLGTSQVEFAIQRILELREAVQELNNETSGNALDKKLREIEQAGEKAKLPLKEIASLKEDYTKAFQGAVVRDFNKALLELTGSAQEIRAAKMEETIDEWRKKFVEAKVPAEEMAAKLSELRAGLMQKEDLERLEEATDWLSGLRRAMADMSKDAQDWGSKVEGLWSSAADTMTDAIATFCTTGKANFSDMANSIISDIIRMTTRAMIIQPLMDAIGSGIADMFTSGGFPGAGTDAIAPSANGNVFLGGSLAAFSGHVVDRPTLFSYGSRIPAYASGAGLMGEAGPEAIMPLTRMGNGRLGVAAQGGAPMINITVTNAAGGNSSAEVTDQRRNGSGGFDIDILISQIDSKLAARAAQNKSSLVQYMDKSRGLNSARGLY